MSLILDKNKVPILEMKNVNKTFSNSFFTKKPTFALKNFNITIDTGFPKIHTVAGESGSGKTTIANIALNFIKPTSGNVYFKGKNLTKLSKSELLQYRREIQVIFQDPFGVYNPFYTINNVFTTLLNNFKISSNKNKQENLVSEALLAVGLDPLEVLNKYPHEFSGGQLQRIMIARAFLAKPKVIIADEPVSMIDASLSAKLLEVLIELRDKHNISFIYITHDLSTAYHIGNNIMILYKGAVVEYGNVKEVMKNPQHPYVKLLLESIPLPNPDKLWKEDKNLMFDKDFENYNENKFIKINENHFTRMQDIN